MRLWHSRLKSLSGFSIIEVMIALLLTGIITTAAFKAYVTQHKNYMVQDDVTDIQQSARAAIGELTKQIRMAGYQLPYGLPSIIPGNANPDTITVTYHRDGCDTWLSAAMTSTTQNLTCGSSVSCFSVGQWVYIFEPDSAKGEWFQISGINSGSGTIQHATGFSRKYGLKSTVLSMARVQFYVSTSDTEHPKLMMKAIGQAEQVYAEDISDLQFQYKLTNGSTVDVPAQIEDVREVIISVTGRSAHMDPDRPSGDQYRFRTYTSSVSLRNLNV
jgi:Tfp pilus assembly protein PilW